MIGSVTRLIRIYWQKKLIKHIKITWTVVVQNISLSVTNVGSSARFIQKFNNLFLPICKYNIKNIGPARKTARSIIRCFLHKSTITCTKLYKWLAINNSSIAFSIYCFLAIFIEVSMSYLIFTIIIGHLRPEFYWFTSGYTSIFFKTTITTRFASLPSLTYPNTRIAKEFTDINISYQIIKFNIALNMWTDLSGERSGPLRGPVFSHISLWYIQ